MSAIGCYCCCYHVDFILIVSAALRGDRRGRGRRGREEGAVVGKSVSLILCVVRCVETWPSNTCSECGKWVNMCKPVSIVVFLVLSLSACLCEAVFCWPQIPPQSPSPNSPRSSYQSYSCAYHRYGCFPSSETDCEVYTLSYLERYLTDRNLELSKAWPQSIASEHGLQSMAFRAWPHVLERNFSASFKARCR